jgi:hypothetical protein
MKLSLHVVLAFTILVLVTFSCKKSEIKQPTETNLTNTELAKKINNFMPDEANMGSVYRKFISTHVNNDNTLKTSLTDGVADTTLWNIETYLNTTYGFKIDTPYYQHSNYEEIINFTVTDYSGSVPVLDGDELSSFINEKNLEFLDENTDNDNIYILNTTLEFDEVRDGKAYVTMNVVLGTNYWGVYPPGYDPENFPNFTCMYAVRAGECSDEWWLGANREYEKRYEYRTKIIPANNNEIWVNVSIGGVSCHDEDRLWSMPWITDDYILSTSGNDELNQYLQSTKDVVDDYNPGGWNGLFLGNIWVYKSQVNISPYIWTGHSIEFRYFRKFTITPPGN